MYADIKKTAYEGTENKNENVHHRIDHSGIVSRIPCLLKDFRTRHRVHQPPPPPPEPEWEPGGLDADDIA